MKPLRPAALAALMLTPSIVAAQDTPVASTPPVPQIATEAAPSMEPQAPATPVTPSSLDTPASALPVVPEASAASPQTIDTETVDADPETAKADPVIDPQAVVAATTSIPMPAEPLFRQEALTKSASDASQQALKFLREGGPSIWAIAGLSVITLALILWKVWRLALIGAWARGKAGRAVSTFERGEATVAREIVRGRRGIRSKVVATTLAAVETLPEDRAREETARVAKLHLASAGSGLGALELIATIAPLLGLLGTVLGMIAAFQALQAAGSKADPALLAGGIWEALLTTAAGMAVAIPASAALTWFEAVIGRIRRDIEDNATRIFVAHVPQQTLTLAAE
ncbi:MotA/TolQ/ExbB proton channel family protein [Phaeobacter sp. C3_T13_0]|uniref:MotA/TolQ/ExbB proton channel family protein n=1 Tax=Phaeobacter cretensis TaxID=3342641 RepID=UPI0039BD1510